MTSSNEDRLPSDLLNLPLVSAICEIRVQSTQGLSNVIPGILFSKLPGEKKIQRLPAMDIPQEFRAADSSVKYTPLVALKCEGFAVSVSDYSLIIECEMPYPGWTSFKSKIVEVVNACFSEDMSGLVTGIERYSLKYDDVIEITDQENLISGLNANISIGSFKVGGNGFNARLEAKSDNIVYIVTVAGPGLVKVSGIKSRRGVVVSIDTISELESAIKPITFRGNLETYLDTLHSANKKKFFECITKDTLSLLEPKYD